MTHAPPPPRALTGGGGHHPIVVIETIGNVAWTALYRAACSCGYRRETTNTKRENAIRAARRHVQEAQS